MCAHKTTQRSLNIVHMQQVEVEKKITFAAQEQVRSFI